MLYSSFYYKASSKITYIHTYYFTFAEMSQSTLTFNSVMVQNEKLNDVERILKEMARPTRVSVEAATKLETGARGTGLLETERFDKFFNTFVITSRSEFRSQYDEMKENRDVKALKKKKLFKQCQSKASLRKTLIWVFHIIARLL